MNAAVAAPTFETLVYEKKEAADEGPPLSSLQPRDQFVRYYRREHGVEEVPGDLLRSFDEVLEETNEG